MAVWQRPVTMDTTTLEGVVEWINAVHEGMLAVGCVQTDDLGQLDIENIPAPVLGGNTNYGFRIYEINDSMSASLPIYIKIEFVGRRHGTDTTSMGFSLISISHGTDGNGELEHPRAEAGTPYGSLGSAYSGDMVPDAPSYCCKVDGFMFLLVGCGYYNYRSTSYINSTATFFALSRLVDGSVVLWHFHNLGATAGASNAGELSYSTLSSLVGVAEGPRSYGLSSPPTSEVGGKVVATPAIVASSSAAYADTNILSVPTLGTDEWKVLSLSINDFDSTPYLVLKTTRTSFPIHAFPARPDTRAGTDSAIALRWEA